MDGEQMDYKVYQVEVNVETKVIVFAREVDGEAASYLAQDKIEEQLKRAFHEITDLDMSTVRYSQIDIYQQEI